MCACAASVLVFFLIVFFCFQVASAFAAVITALATSSDTASIFVAAICDAWDKLLVRGSTLSDKDKYFPARPSFDELLGAYIKYVCFNVKVNTCGTSYFYLLVVVCSKFADCKPSAAL